jgi:hypothetical protein
VAKVAGVLAQRSRRRKSGAQLNWRQGLEVVRERRDVLSFYRWPENCSNDWCACQVVVGVSEMML